MIIDSLFESLSRALGTSVLLWCAALIFGALGGVLVCIIAVSRFRIMRIIGNIWIEVTRGIPTIVALFIVFFGLAALSYKQSALVAAIVGMGLVSTGYLGDIFRSGLLTVPQGQREASASVGVGQVSTLTRIVIPQTLPVIAATGGTYAIHLLKETALASLIGVPELMSFASYLVERGGFPGIMTFPLLGLFYVTLSLPLLGLTVLFRKRANQMK